MADGGNEDRFVQKLNFSGSNLAANWKSFKAQLNIYKIAKKFSEMSEEVKIANTLLLMGSESVPIYEQFQFSTTDETETKTLDNVLAMFDKHFEPVKNLIYERMKFNSIVQGELPIHQFIIKLQTQADVCEYGAMKDELVRDRIVVGVSDKKLREYLIDLEDLNLQRCIQKAKQFVSHHEQSEQLASSSSASGESNLDVVKSQNNRSSGSNFRPWENKQTEKKLWKNCMFCKYGPHNRDNCPARNALCNVCKERGHWAKSRACKGKKTKSANEVTEKVEGLFLGSESD